MKTENELMAQYNWELISIRFKSLEMLVESSGFKVFAGFKNAKGSVFLNCPPNPCGNNPDKCIFIFKKGLQLSQEMTYKEAYLFASGIAFNPSEKKSNE